MSSTFLKELRSGIAGVEVFEDASVAVLYEHSILYDKSSITSTGALSVRSGAKTGRSPKDKRVVKEDSSKDDVSWGSVNIPLEPSEFETKRDRAFGFLRSCPRLYIINAFAGWDVDHRIAVSVVASRPYHALFMKTMLVPPRNDDELKQFEQPDYVIYNAGEQSAEDGKPNSACVALNFAKREMVILGTQYAGEMKKGAFTIMNYLMPKKAILSMHASCNCDPTSKSASIFFGLSGTGKTTLSTDPNRTMVGDDEHCWTEHGVFNIENGCYAKCVNLKKEDEPDIYNSIKFGAVVENVVMDEKTREIDFTNVSITENTRVAYPLSHLPVAAIPASIDYHPQHVFFLTYDAFGVLPPVSRLDFHQAMYHFVNGFTSKVAGTEQGVTEPQATFSACFGEPFMVHDPVVYAKLLAQKMQRFSCKVWLINTGYVQGKYGSPKGHRMKLKQTRAVIDAIHRGDLEDDSLFKTKTPIFNLSIPSRVKGVPDELLDPALSWEPEEYSKTIKYLADLFAKNFHHHHKANHDREISEGGPHYDPSN